MYNLCRVSLIQRGVLPPVRGWCDGDALTRQPRLTEAPRRRLMRALARIPTRFETATAAAAAARGNILLHTGFHRKTESRKHNKHIALAFLRR